MLLFTDPHDTFRNLVQNDSESTTLICSFRAEEGSVTCTNGPFVLLTQELTVTRDHDGPDQ